jgi:hypothetical protein
MKKITFLFTLLLTITLSFGQELITNGDFEAGNTNGWYNTGANISASITLPYAGTYRGNMGNDFCSIRQDITVATNVEYTVSFWWRFNNTTTTDGFVSIRSNIDNSEIDNSVSTLSSGTTTWTNVTFTFTSTTVTDVRIQMNKNTSATGENNSIAIDNVSIVPSSSLSVNDLAQFNFKSYPNPAKDYINLSAAKNINKVEIYTLLGQQVKSIPLNSNSAKVNVSGLSKGVYLVKTFIEDAVGTYKFIKE